MYMLKPCLREIATDEIQEEKIIEGAARVYSQVIAPDFSLEFAGFFPREKSRKTTEISGTSREKSGK